MGKNKKNKDKNDTAKTGGSFNNDQLGENASGIDRQDEVYKKEHNGKDRK